MKKFIWFVFGVMLIAFRTDAVLGQSGFIIGASSFEDRTGDESLVYLKTEVPELIITFLSVAAEGTLRIVDRSAIDKLIELNQMSLSEFFNKEQAAEFGRLSGTTHVIVGSISKLSERTISINARLVSTETGLIRTAKIVNGSRNELHSICNDIAVAFRNVLREPPPPKSKSVFKKWWFWGGVAAAGAGAALFLKPGDDPGQQFTDVIITIRLP